MQSRNRAFTLIELLVVIAIIAILAAILFPVFAQAKLAAKKTADLSNVKQNSLSFPMYASDNDDTAPFNRVVENGGDWWSPRMKNWKDLTYPYSKSGGSRSANVGVTYTTSADGGILQSPLSSNAWSNAPVWWSMPGSGDETTRWPRSYAVNMSAGFNEVGGRFWPNVGDSGGSGSMTMFANPAGTIMLSSSKLPFPDVAIETATTYECTAEGQPWGGTGIGCSVTDGGGAVNYGFFDGHAKHVKVVQSISNDMWDVKDYLAAGHTINGCADLPCIAAQARNIAEYNK